MANYKIKKRVNKNVKRLGKRLFIIGAAGFIGLAPFVKEESENVATKRIEENAELKAPRSLRNIKQEKMGKYLRNQIEVLYNKYPNLDELMYSDSDETKDSEFIDDIYLLYKAYMVDRADEEVGNIEDVKVTTVDQIIMQSDLISEEQENGTTEKIAQTYKEQYKAITDAFIKAKNGEMTGADLAKRMYELLADELGLEDQVKTSEEIAEEIDEKGFYYDEKNDIFYTDEGKAKLVNESELEENQEAQENETEQENQEEEISDDGLEY